MTLLFTFLPFPVTKQSLLKKLIKKKREIKGKTAYRWSLKQAQVSLTMAHHNHHSPPPPMVASSDQNLYLYLSISLPFLDQTQTQKYQLFSLHPILSKPQPLLSLDQGLKRYRRRERLRFGFRW